MVYKKSLREGYLKTGNDSSGKLRLDSIEWVVDTYGVLVKRIAHHLTARMPPQVSIDDMIQAGMLGLIESAQKYDDSKGASFETYAGIRIRGAMLDEVRRGDWVPRSVYRNSRKVSDAIKEIENRTGRDAKDDEIAKQLGVTKEEYFTILQDVNSAKLFSINELVGYEDGVPDNNDKGPFSQPDKAIQDSSLVEALVEAIKTIPEREQLVLSLYYEEELNLREIGEVIGVSESRVSQIHTQAAHRLRSRLGDW